MKRTTITLAALVVALLPAGAGLWGNASFSQAVPVKVPASVQVATGTATLPTSSRTPEAGDDHGGDTPRDQRTEPGDDRDNRDDSTTSTRSSSTSGHSSGRSGHSATSSGASTTADDHGGDTPRDQRTEPGDDRDSATSGHSGSEDSGSDDSGSGHSGSDDSGSEDSGSDDSTSGSGGHGGLDDSGSDDHGGHGSDD